jgi:hypothetical protein
VNATAKPNGPRPRVGTLMRDTKRDRVGVVMGELAGLIYLRPVGGGIEWDACASDLERADGHAQAEARAQLRARLAEMNAASSGGVL